MNPQSLEGNTHSSFSGGMYIHIITLKEWLKEQAYDVAWKTIDVQQMSPFSKQLKDTAEQVLATSSTTPLEEFIEVVSPSIIQIGVDRDIIDNNAMNYAISCLLDHVESNGMQSLLSTKRHRLNS